MPFSWTVGEYNAQGSFNRFFKNNINTSLPAWASGNFRLAFNYPDEPLFDPTTSLISPVFSVTHLAVTDEVIAQGDLVDGAQRGQRIHGIADVSCWVYAVTTTNEPNYNWPRDLMQMRDMVKKLFGANKAFAIVDIYTSSTNPSSTNYIVRVERVEEQETQPDPNPNVKRRRMLVYYTYTERQ